ncbi:uncharacterized protein VTP21DRAFT_10686 [Calcarisporiella thermophila]|uniref:uncharacterized protein n=1 Tax=Calcarisporiella thermophila TaxID=911321 RepID=UPI0037449559
MLALQSISNIRSSINLNLPFSILHKQRFRHDISESSDKYVQSQKEGVCKNRGVEELRKEALSMTASPRYIAPRHALVFCHGLFGFDTITFGTAIRINYWGSVPDFLRNMGCKIILTKVPRAGSIEQRAFALDSIIKSALPNQPINLIAHSMGGLDCRYLISRFPCNAYRPLSLTTLSTPHHGSSFMDWCRDHFGVGVIETLNAAQKVSEKISPGVSAAVKLNSGERHEATVVAENEGRRTELKESSSNKESSSGTSLSLVELFTPLINKIGHMLDAPAFSNLSTEFLGEHFNPTINDSPDVAYYSYGAAAKDIPFAHPLWIPWTIVTNHEGENDGLVSTKSAKWGQYLGTLECNHWDFTNSMGMLTSSKFDEKEFYAELVSFLARQGF